MIEIIRCTPDEWENFAETAHKLVFKEVRDCGIDRISFALLAANGKDAVAYVTCRELDRDSLYWQYGGAIDEYRGFVAVKAFSAFHEYCKSRYKRITTLVKNDNINYLHLLMKNDFRAIGIRNFKGEILLEMYWENADAI